VLLELEQAARTTDPAASAEPYRNDRRDTAEFSLTTSNPFT
jgi:hypothetical protein